MNHTPIIFPFEVYKVAPEYALPGKSHLAYKPDSLFGPLNNVAIRYMGTFYAATEKQAILQAENL